MFTIRSVIFLLSFSMWSMGCARAVSDSRVRIALPEGTPTFHSKSGKVSAQDISQFCYLISVTGDGITPPANAPACAPVLPLTSGFRFPGSMVEMVVPRGKTRKVELFGYVPKRNQSCSSINADLRDIALNRMFRLGLKENIDMSQENTDVEIVMRFPGFDNHVGVQDQMASSCYAGLPDIDWNGSLNSNPATLRMSADARTVSSVSTGVRLKGRVGAALPKAKLTSSQGVKLIVR